MFSPVKDRLALARSHLRRGERAAAETIFLALLKDHPDFADVHHEAGLFFHEGGDFERAQQEFRRALEINPGYTEAALHLSIIWNDVGRYEEAHQVYEDAVRAARRGGGELDPPLAQRVASLYSEIGDVYAQAGEWERAASAYREGLTVCPGFHDVRMRLAQALLDAGNASAAIEELKRITQATPELIAARLLLGLACRAAGRKDEAKAVWAAILEKQPDHPRARLYLGALEKS